MFLNDTIRTRMPLDSSRIGLSPFPRNTWQHVLHTSPDFLHLGEECHNFVAIPELYRLQTYQLFLSCSSPVIHHTCSEHTLHHLYVLFNVPTHIAVIERTTNNTTTNNNNPTQSVVYQIFRAHQGPLTQRKTDIFQPLISTAHTYTIHTSSTWVR